MSTRKRRTRTLPIFFVGALSLLSVMPQFGAAQTETSVEREYPITEDSTTDGGTVQIDTYDLGGNPLTKTIEFVQDISLVLHWR